MPTSTLEIASALEELLADPGFRARNGLNGFSAADRDLLGHTAEQVAQLMGDRSLQASIGNALWLDGASIINGTVTAPKIEVESLSAIVIDTGDLNITGTVTAAAAFPATGARITIDSTGLKGYNSTPATTFTLLTDGSGSIGIGGTALSWDTAGVVSIPVAAIGSLTIADIGSGNLGGTYTTSGATTRLEFSSTAFIAYASGVETFKLNATTGAVTATGSFTIKSAASGARVEISSAGGIVGYNSSGTQTFLLNAATGAGQLGTGTVTWNSSGAVSINGSVLVNGTVTANAVTGGTINNGSSGTVNLGAADVVVNSTGKLKFGASSQDYLSNNELYFEVGPSETAKIKFKDSSYSPYGYVYGDTSSTYGRSGLKGYYSATIFADVAAYGTSTSAFGSISGYHSSYGTTTVSAAASSTSGISFTVANNTAGKFETTNRRLLLNGYLYPGNGTSQQTSRYIYDTGTYTGVSGGLYLGGGLYPGGQTTNYKTGSSVALIESLGGTTSSYSWYVRNSSSATRFAVRADGAIMISTGVRDDGATGVSGVTSVWAIYDTGGSLVGYIPIYSSYS